MDTFLLGAVALRGGFTNGVGQIWLDDLGCRGVENRLINCPHLAFGVHNCNHNEDVGVRCLASNPQPSMQDQLAGYDGVVLQSMQESWAIDWVGVPPPLISQ